MQVWQSQIHLADFDPNRFLYRKNKNMIMNTL